MSAPRSVESALRKNTIPMKKTLLYRLFGLGKIPRQLRSMVESEGIIVADEGIGGLFIAKHVNGPGRRYRNRAEGFTGCLVVTKKRVLCYTYGKRQINISVDDPRVSELQVTHTKSRNPLHCLRVLRLSERVARDDGISIQHGTGAAFP